ncbi:MAG: peroxiredoxin [Betaproteobacteria bacterium]|nr:peroxiredoxin [Betaproteobacteria bacterium]
MSIAVGEVAPAFELKDQHGALRSLAEFRGRAVLVTFVPFAFTGTCTSEVCALRDESADFVNDDVQTLVITCDSAFTLKEWAAQQQLDYPVLSDFWPHGAVAKAYGVFNADLGCALRGTFLVDAGGFLRWSIVNGLGEARSTDDYRSALASLTV